MVMALEMCRVMVALSLMAFWYSVEQSVSVKPIYRWVMRRSKYTSLSSALY